MNRTLLAGLAILMTILTMIVFGPILPMVDASLERILVYRDSNGVLLSAPYPPSEDFLIGSDRRGVDLFSKIVIGSRETFYILVVIVGLRMISAFFLSVGAFYSKSIRLFMNIWNSLFSFMPTIFIILILLAIPSVMFSDYHSFWVLLIVSMVDVGRLSMLYFGTMNEVKQKPYFEAGIASGGSRWTLFKNYFWPVLKNELVVTGASEMGRTMFLLVQLGVIGVYVNQKFMSQLDGSYKSVEDSNSWTVLLDSLLEGIYSSQWIPISALVIITYSMIGFYLLAEGLRKQQDIKLRRFYN